MKRSFRKVPAIAGITAILVTGALGSCSKADVSETVDTSAETTVDETVAEETTESSITYEVPDPEDIDIPDYAPLGYADWYYYPDFVSTNGELEGQDEYMRLRLDYGMPRHFYYDDLEEIEDPDTRALAQAYADEGYDIYMPAGGATWGDIEYEFYNAFGAQYMDGEIFKEVYVAKMNETLFNYFISSHWDYSEGAYYDDGIVVGTRYQNDTSGYCTYTEFNRETGYAITVSQEVRPEYWPIDPMNIDFENEILEAYAQACVNDGYIIWPNDNIENYNSCAGGDYTCSEGFSFYNGNCYVEYIAMEEGVFDIISSPEWRYIGGDYYTEDDGTVVTVTYENEDGSPVFIFIYDRSTGLANVVDLFLG